MDASMPLELRRRGGDSSSIMSPSLRSASGGAAGGTHSHGGAFEAGAAAAPTGGGASSSSAASAANSGMRSSAAFAPDDFRRDQPTRPRTSSGPSQQDSRGAAERKKRVRQLQQNHQRRLLSKQLYSKLRGLWWLLLLVVLLAYYGCLRAAQQQQQPYAADSSSVNTVFSFDRRGDAMDRGRSYSRRVIHFSYFDASDKRRIEGVDKIRSFHRQMNSTVDRLPPYAMTTEKFLRGLENSRDYRHLGEPLETQDCQEQFAWQSQVRPTCNTLHEFADLSALEGEEGGGGDGDIDSRAGDATTTVRTKLVANGYWRDVWVVTDDHGVRVVKTLRYEHRLTLRNYDRNRRDAMALEHLTSSRYVVDIYGYCSAAGLFEYSNGGDITNAIWPRNESLALTPLRKLQIATQGAMALAAVHNVDREGQATIAHTDIGPDQFILIGDRYKLNDFNRARFLLKFKGNGTNCPYFVNKNPGKNRSPEEYAYKPQTEKVDVYSFGNIIYSLLQEELPFQDTRSKSVPDLVMKGVRPSIYYDIWNSTDPIVVALKEAMIMCHEGEPEDRASARQVEVYLKSKLEEFDPGRLQEWGDTP